MTPSEVNKLNESLVLRTLLKQSYKKSKVKFEVVDCSRKVKFCVIINVQLFHFMYFFVSSILCNCHSHVLLLCRRCRHMECSRRILSRVFLASPRLMQSSCRLPTTQKYSLLSVNLHFLCVK